MNTPEDLTKEQLVEIVNGFMQSMYGEGPETEWGPDTLDDIADILYKHGLTEDGDEESSEDEE